jgi:hypothetical protein
MSNKSSAKSSSIATLTDQLGRVPEHVQGARKALVSWRDHSLRMMKKSPGRSLLGAFAIGFVVAKLARLV